MLEYKGSDKYYLSNRTISEYITFNILKSNIFVYLAIWMLKSILQLENFFLQLI